MRFWKNTIPSTKKFQALKNLRITSEISVNLDWFELKCIPSYLIESSQDNVLLHKIKSFIERLYDGPNLIQHDLLQLNMSFRDLLVVLQQLSIFCKPDTEGAIRIISSA